MSEYSPTRRPRPADATQGAMHSEFERHVGEAFNSVQNTLTGVQESLNHMPALVTSGLTTIVRSTLDDMLATVQQVSMQSGPPPPPPPPPPHSSKDGRLQPLQDEIRTLTAKNSSLIDVKTTLDREMSSLRADLQKKTREVKKLHGIIIQTGQPDESFTDEEIVKDFGSLYHEILRVVSAHFSMPNPRAKASASNKMNRSDAGLLTRSRIALKLFLSFFGPDLHLYGLDLEREKEQKDLEHKMRERGVPESDILEWRIALVKAVMKMDMKSKKTYALDIADDLLEDLEGDCLVGDGKAARKDVDQLCVDAWKIALRLRSSRSVYEWHQNCSVNHIPPADMELTGPYNVRNEAAPLVPVRVLFGPLYKVVDGDRVLLRQGDVLNGN